MRSTFGRRADLAAALGQEAGEPLGGQGAAEVETLHLLATLFPHEVELLPGLDSLGHHVDAESRSQSRDRADDLRVRAPRRDVGDERAIDLQTS